MTTEQLPEGLQLPDGLQLAVRILAEIGDERSDAAIAAVHDLADERDKRVTMQHHAADQAQQIEDLRFAAEAGGLRIAELEAERDNLVDAMREEIGEGLRLRELGGALPGENITAMTERVIRERDALRARMAEIEAQEPVAWIERLTGRLASTGDEHRSRFPMVYDPLYARPVPAQAGQSVYLVAAGLTCDEQELYTRHDAPVPMAINEHLYAATQEHKA